MPLRPLSGGHGNSLASPAGVGRARSFLDTVVATLRRPRIRGRAGWTLAILVAVIAVGVLLSFLLDEPLRRYVEGKMNAQLTGYRVSIGALSFHPVGLSLTLTDLVFVQEANPDPPVAHIARLDASVQWKALLSARLVANFALERPKLHVNLPQLRKEAADPQPVTDKGWQEAFQAIYPLKINEFTIVNGEVTYIDDGPFPPLEVTAVNFVADNIRNIRSKEREYPSAVHLDAVVFKTGKIIVDGHADFLAEPHLGIKGDVTLDAIELDYFKAITTKYNVTVNRGLLSARGVVEYAPTIKVVDLENATIRQVGIEYAHAPARKGVVQEAAAKTAQKAKEVSDEPDLLLRAKEVKVVDSTVGFVNRAQTPAYRVFLTEANLTVTNFSNQRAEGAAVAKLNGKFMGSGPTAAVATFRSDKKGPDFDLELRLENTDMRTMNDILRAYANFDVTAGRFSLFSQLSVKNQRVEGYVKPLFSGLDIYHPEQDREKGLARKLYEKVVEGVSKVLKNVPREEVATVATISGPIDGAAANTLEVIVKLIQNAFFKAIMPGFEREVRGLGGRRTRPEGS
jgi:Domain of Unknown Function (DUF748)